MKNIINVLKDLTITLFLIVLSSLAYYDSYTELSILLLLLGFILSYFSIKSYKIISLIEKDLYNLMRL